MHSKIDSKVLVDIISNVAGMMILLACITVLVNQRSQGEGRSGENFKPITYPMAYIPEKQSVTIGLRYGKLYDLPEETVLRAVAAEVKSGKPIQELSLVTDDVAVTVRVTPTHTGFRFQYRFLPDAGIDLSDSEALVNKLDELLTRYPSDKFFFSFHTWPECFTQFRDIREYLSQRGVEVGWSTRTSTGEKAYDPNDPDAVEIFDVIYSFGEFSQDMSTIKAQ